MSHTGSRKMILTLSALAITSIAGCGNTSQQIEARSTTIGQELEDLEDARNKGLLTEDEYNTKRREIMKRK